jgi:hypothetical protein
MRGVVLVALVGACATDADVPPEVAAFLGKATFQPGAQTVFNCTDDALDRTTPLVTLELATGARSDLVEVVAADAPCPGVALDVDGDVADALPGQSCTELTGGLTIVSTLVKYTIAIEAGVLTLDGNYNANVSGGASAVCTTTLSGTAIQD